MPHEPQKRNPKIAFFGTPDLAADILGALVEAKFDISLVITSPDRPKGRGMVMTATPVKEKAEAAGIRVLTPEKLDDAFISEFKNSGCDMAIVAAYGKIIPEKILSIPALGFWNIHYSLLPRWRGATPVESAILADDKETGVSIQKMVFALDAGDVAAEEKVAMREGETARELRTRLNDIAERLIVDLVPKIADGSVRLRAQDLAHVTLCKKIKKEDGLIDPLDTSRAHYLKYLAYHDWPRLYFFKDGKRCVVSKAEWRNGKFVITRVIPEGKKEIAYTC